MNGQEPSEIDAPVKSFSDDKPSEINPAADLPAVMPSDEFLSETLTLTPAQEEPSLDYEYERYTMSEAGELLRPEYASAVVLKDLTSEDLKILTGLPFEAGIAVLDGELVLFSSGNRDEIYVNPPVLEMLRQASFVAHTHPEGTLEGPSRTDILNAGPATEYVLTPQQAFAYNREGLLAAGDGYEECLLAFYETLNAEREGNSSALRARSLLNEFIREMDALNTQDTVEKTVFRSDGAAVTLEAEAMQTSGVTWNGGSFVTLWGNGRASTDYQVDEAGIYEIEITALSDEKGRPVLPQLRFSIDGAIVREPVEVSNNSWQFKPYVWTGVELTAGLHAFEAAVFIEEGGQSITLDRMVLRKTGEISYPAARVQIEAGTMQTSGIAWKGGPFVTMWGGGSASADYQVDEAGVYEVEVVAVSDDQGAAVPPQLRLSVDNSMTPGPVSVTHNNWQFKSYVWPEIELTAGMHALETGLFSNSTGQSITLTRILLRKVGEIPYPTARIQAEAEALQASGTTWNGGTFLTMWKGGRALLDYEIGEPGLYQVEVIANANDAGNAILPQLRYSADGAAASEPVNLSNNHWLMKPYALGEIELTAGPHHLELEAFRVLTDQSISVDRLLIRKISEEADVVIQNGQNFTNSRQVDLDLSALGSSSEIADMRYGWASPQGTAFSDWEDFSISKTVTMPEGDGVKTLECQVRDRSGNGTMHWGTIVLDTTPPAGSVAVNLGAPSTNRRDVTLQLTGSDSGSGLGWMRFSTDSGAGWTDWESFTPSRTVTLPEGDGPKTVLYQIWDGAWNLSTFSAVITVDTVPPAVSFLSPALANSASYTLRYEVSDNFDAVRTLSETITLSQGANLLERTVTDGAGNTTTLTRIVSYVPVSNLGDTYNTTDAAFDWVETDVPTGIILDEQTQSFTLPFSFRFFDEMYTQILVSSNGVVQFGGTSGSAYPSTQQLPNTRAPNTIAAPLWRDLDPSKGGTITYASSPSRFVVSWDNIYDYFGSGVPQRFQMILDSDGSIVFQYDSVTFVSTTVTGIENASGTKGVQYQMSPKNKSALQLTPVASRTGLLFINQGGLYSPTRDVTVTLESAFPENKISEMRFSTDGGSSWTSWETFSETKALSLPEGDGRKGVLCQIKDADGALGEASDDIILDMEEPFGTVSINQNDRYTQSNSVTLSLTDSDLGSGVDKMSFSTDGGQTWSDWQSFSATKTLTLPPGDGEKEVRVRLKDKVGHVGGFSDTIILDSAMADFDTYQGVRKTLVLGPLSNAAGGPLTYQFSAPENLLLNGRFSLLKNQLTYIPNENFTGSGILAIQISGGDGPVEYGLQLRVLSPQVNTPNDPSLSAQYNLRLARAVRAWNLSRGAGVTVAVIDTGINRAHADLQNQIYTNPGEIAGDGADNDGNGFIDDVHGWDFKHGDNNPADDGTGGGHGTHVAGIVGAESNNGTGVAGIAPDTSLMAVKVFDGYEGGDGLIDSIFQNVANGIRYAIELGARVINMSLGWLTSGISPVVVQAIKDAIAAARAAGAVIVASAGNKESDVALYTPAALAGVITVAATTSSDVRAYFSNYGEEVEVAAPGSSIYSTYLSGYAYESGTSMAAPLVAGLAALILSQDPSSTDADVLRRLKYSSVDLGTAGFDPYYGYGRIDAFQALSYDYYDDGSLKTQYLEKPDEHGWNRLFFDPEGYLTGGI